MSKAKKQVEILEKKTVTLTPSKELFDDLRAEGLLTGFGYPPEEQDPIDEPVLPALTDLDFGEWYDLKAAALLLHTDSELVKQALREIEFLNTFNVAWDDHENFKITPRYTLLWMRDEAFICTEHLTNSNRFRRMTIDDSALKASDALDALYDGKEGNLTFDVKETTGQVTLTIGDRSMQAEIRTLTP